MSAADPARDVEKSRQLRLLCVLFFFSGCPALIYQLTWQRELFLIFGVNIESVTIVVTAFMLGLGFGSLTGGWLSKRRDIALLPLLLGWPLMLAPVHIAFLEMVIDPVCSIVFEAEAEEDDVMRRRPRDPSSPLFSGALIVWSVIQGAMVFGLVAAILAVSIHDGMAEIETRALVFATLVAANFGLVFVNRSFSASVVAAFRAPNRALWAVLAVTVTMLGVVLFWGPTRHLFQFGPLHLPDLALCIGGGIVTLIALDWLKPLWRAKLTS